MRASNVVLASAAALASCTSVETPSFVPNAQQEAIVRDGQPALISKKPKSVVMVRPATRSFQGGERPAFVVAVLNTGPAPATLYVHDVRVSQSIPGDKPYELKVYSYDDLVAEEKQAQLNRAILVSLAAGANAAAAANAGYYNASGTVYSPYGVSRVTVSGYDPSAAAIANANAAATNSAMIADAVETGQRNLAVLEQSVMKDNTVLPGEWYGGRVVIAPPKLVATDKPKVYRITVSFAGEVHEIDVTQSRASG